MKHSMFCFGFDRLLYNPQHFGDLLSTQGHCLQVNNDSQICFLGQNSQFFYWWFLLLYRSNKQWNFLKLCTRLSSTLPGQYPLLHGFNYSVFQIHSLIQVLSPEIYTHFSNCSFDIFTQMIFQTFLTQLTETEFVVSSIPKSLSIPGFLFSENGIPVNPLAEARILEDIHESIPYPLCLVNALILVLKYISYHCSSFYPHPKQASVISPVLPQFVLLVPPLPIIIHSAAYSHRNLFRTYI